MKEQIIIFYNKDRKNSKDYIVKRVLTQEGDCFTIDLYYMINGKLKNFPSKLKISGNKLNSYLLQCKKSKFFNRVEYQNIMEV